MADEGRAEVAPDFESDSGNFSRATALSYAYADVASMLETIGARSIDDLFAHVPA